MALASASGVWRLWRRFWLGFGWAYVCAPWASAGSRGDAGSSSRQSRIGTVPRHAINSKTQRRRRPASLARLAHLAPPAYLLLASSVGDGRDQGCCSTRVLLCARTDSGWDEPLRSPRPRRARARPGQTLLCGGRAGLVLGARVIRGADRCRCRSRSTKPPPNGSCGQQGGGSVARAHPGVDEARASRACQLGRGCIRDLIGGREGRFHSSRGGRAGAGGFGLAISARHAWWVLRVPAPVPDDDRAAKRAG